jgi:hypothetical protein
MKRVLISIVALIGVLSLMPFEQAKALSSDPKMFISADNTFYAYVKAGETVDVSFLRVNQQEPFDTTQEDITITVDGPGVEQQRCVAQKNTPIGKGCVFSPVTAQKTGIWRIQFEVPSTAKSYKEVSSDVQWGKNLFSWNIAIEANGQEQSGRIWTERYSIRQPPAASYKTDFTYYYISEDGYIYRTKYGGFNGQISTLSADGVGLRKADTCESAYRSTEVNDTKFTPAFGACGSAYKLFFEEPTGSLPVKATTWDGKEDWVRPSISKPSISELHFSPDETTDQQSGDISFYLKNFIGQYEIKIDVEGDGSFDGQDDVTIRQQMKRLTAGLQKVSFDGTDRAGRILPRNQKIGIKVVITKVAEIHLVAADVEERTGGLELYRINGAGSPSTGLCWNDTELEPLAADSTPEKLDGRNCNDSTGGVHAWGDSSQSWGNARYIDDWAYARAELVGNNTITYPNEDEEVAAAANGSVLPYIVAAVSLVGIGVVIVAVVIAKRRSKKQLQTQLPPQYDYLPPTQSTPTSAYDGTPPKQPPFNG